jgi:hypothetical protein
MDWKEMLKKYIKVDVSGLLIDWVLETVVKPKLEDIVKDSSNVYDDMLLSYVYPLLKQAAEKAAQDLEDELNG